MVGVWVWFIPPFVCESGWCLRFKGGIRSLTCAIVIMHGKNVRVVCSCGSTPSLIYRLNFWYFFASWMWWNAFSLSFHS